MDEIMELLRGEDARRYRRAFSRVGWALAALMFLQVACQYLLAVLTALAAPGLLENQWYPYGVAAFCTYAVGFPVCLLILRTLPAQPPERSAGRPGAGTCFGVWLMSLGWLYLSNVVTLALMGALGALRGSPVPNPLDSFAAQPAAVSVLLGCVLAPVAEELCFRRGIIDRLRPWGDGFALCASALLFALTHGNLYQMLYAFTVGCVLGGLYLRTGRVGYTILLHAALNFVSVGLSPLLGLLPGGEWALSLLVLGAMLWAVQWPAMRGKELAGAVGRTGWGRGEVWGHFWVNPGMTVFVLAVVGTVWLTMF